MTDEGLLVLVVFVATIAGLLRFQSRVASVFGAAMLVLLALDLVSQAQMLASFANPGLATLVLLVVCAKALEKTRLLRWLASRVIVASYGSTWLRLFGVTTLASALLNNTAVVATLLAPVRNNNYHSPGKLLLPLSYAAILGGTLTLIGTSTNLIVNSMLLEVSGQSLSFFSFTAVGALAVGACGLVLALVSRTLPDRAPEADTHRDYFIDAKVEPDSTLIGHSVEENGLRHLESLFLVEIVRDNRLISPVAPTEVIQLGDRLVFSGDIDKVFQITQFSGLSLFADANGLLSSNLTEVVIRPGSVLSGKTLKRAGFRALFDAAVVAIRRDGQAVSGKLGEVVLQAGDFLVLAVGEDFSSRHNLAKNFIVLSGVEPESRLNGYREALAYGGFLTVVGLAALEQVALFKGLMLLLGALLFSKCLTINEVIRRLPIRIWVIVAAALMLSHALINCGLVAQLGEGLSFAASSEAAYGMLILLYLCTWLLTELVTNNAAAALIFPLAYGLAESLGVSAMPFVMAVVFGASASFVSPYGYQTNLMVYNAGQYRIADFARAGLPVSLTYALVVLSVIPVFFPFMP